MPRGLRAAHFAPLQPVRYLHSQVQVANLHYPQLRQYSEKR